MCVCGCACMCVCILHVCVCVYVCMYACVCHLVHQYTVHVLVTNQTGISLSIYIIYSIVLFCDLYCAEHLFKSRLKDKKSLVYKYMYLC